jgi:hypothetical protein
MNVYADKSQDDTKKSIANNSSKRQKGGESAFQFAESRSEAVLQERLQKLASNSRQVKQLEVLQEIANSALQVNQLSVYHHMANNGSKDQIIQRRPTLPTQIEDHEFVALLTNGTLQPTRATIRDERRRSDGTPQLLTMLEYDYQGARVFVHIHTAEGTHFGHINIAGGNRLGITSGQAVVLLRIAQESGINTNYSGAGGVQDWERGEYGHES